MLRRALTILSLIGLLLSVGLWGASYFHILYTWEAGPGSDIAYPNEETTFVYMVMISSGGLGFGYDSVPDEVLPSFLGLNAIERTPDSLLAWIPAISSHVGHVWLSAPLWIPTAVFSVPLVPHVFRRFRRRKRKKLGLCVKCGYDLRGSMQRCPECGTEISK